MDIFFKNEIHLTPINDLTPLMNFFLYRESRHLFDKITNYKNRCSTGTAKQFTSVIIYSIQRAHKTYCPNKATKKAMNFFRLQSCTNRVTNQTARCLNHYNEQLQAIKRAPIPKQIPHVCW